RLGATLPSQEIERGDSEIVISAFFGIIRKREYQEHEPHRPSPRPEPAHEPNDRGDEQKQEGNACAQPPRKSSPPFIKGHAISSVFALSPPGLPRHAGKSGSYSRTAQQKRRPRFYPTSPQWPATKKRQLSGRRTGSWAS